MSWKRVILRSFRALGYEISRRGAPDTYSLCSPYGYFTYAPWFEKWFQEEYARVKERTVVTEDRCYMLYRLCQHCTHLDGDVAECGVYKGGTAAMLARTIDERCGARKQLHLFDTFEGMPETADSDPSSHKRGDFGDTSLSSVQALLKDYPFVSIHRGSIPESLEAVGDRRFALVHIDVDLYESTKQALHFFYHRTVRGGMLLFDDYGFPPYVDAAKRAVDEFFEDKPEETISLGTGQCFVIKVSHADLGRASVRLRRPPTVEREGPTSKIPGIPAS